MLRVILRIALSAVALGMLVGFGSMLAPTAAAVPDTCPPTCDQIPAAAWPDPRSLPLDATYRWPALPGLAVAAPAPRFRFEELCAGPPPLDDPRSYAVAAKVVVPAPDGQWQLQAQVLHWRGETWRGGQLAASVFDTAAAALRSCLRAAPQFSPLITTDEPDRMAAVISGPSSGLVAHHYLLADPASSTISELVLWAVPPVQVPWLQVPDARVFDAMATPLCGAYLGSCG
jgi:hypothetical protein